MFNPFDLKILNADALSPLPSYKTELFIISINPDELTPLLGNAPVLLIKNAQSYLTLSETNPPPIILLAIKPLEIVLQLSIDNPMFCAFTILFPSLILISLLLTLST